MVRPTVIDLNPVELKYYLLVKKCSGNCNYGNDLSMRICVSSKTKYISVKEFNMITERNKAKKWRNILHVIVNANSIVQNVIQIKNGIIKHANVNVKIIISAKMIIVRMLPSI